MQAQHIIILTGLTICFLLLTLFIERAIKRDLRRSYWAGKSAGIADSNARMDALNADIAMLARRRARDRKGFLQTIELKNLSIRQLEEQLNAGYTGSLTKTDLQVLSDTAITLGLAHKTWVHIKGTEPWRTRATTQLEYLNAIVLRLIKEIRNSAKSQESQADMGKAA
ncbi:hypothetical protein [Pseudomonas syringae]|uniref:Uncharacterized protein n=1 Tax=Pseudomonas syringae pv. papulans TaxID=83963 RepID=A0A0P9XZN0_PSESX|nr:hypothetical protein [Pseudomonas syringae]KPY34587.1 Uncharacterized protein ALO65_00187 [Pseudomonas syringae pv. papulans]KWS31820.1 hypothetical protein AL059_02005 [Pseudomonas syringae pv. papulans]MDH4604966.1 hypothetical protein [Pseudomonas syringae pv. papulans]MDH4624441.1 hypothetical protein [Pseudomonas syringae pv. papulans]RMN49892.1 hypothetical protein ALQ60_00460 [Pseudomonas syringae pv. papulans]